MINGHDEGERDGESLQGLAQVNHIEVIEKYLGGARTTNGELVTVKTVRADGGIELADGRVLEKDFREFLAGYAITSYGSQGKTVDHVLFSDSTIKAATNAQQWYVTISRGRRGIRIFTPDKIQLRENLVRSGHRPLALELANGFRPRHGHRLWDRLHGYLLRFGKRAADTFCRLKKSRHQNTNKNMSAKSPECYTTDPQARCLRVEISPRQIFLLPLDQFAFAELTTDGKEQLLHLSFATHEIMVHGYALRRIETALHKLELSFITPLPERYHPLIAEGQPKIREIVVTEIKSGSDQSQLN